MLPKECVFSILYSVSCVCVCVNIWKIYVKKFMYFNVSAKIKFISIIVAEYVDGFGERRCRGGEKRCSTKSLSPIHKCIHINMEE